ncbi:NDP-hexose 2,3-dehydratase family protein [bacterium]|nr:NDP-hexose 2,3-dehydratase family protein [bacterium]MDC0304525.1 NDP-hexose 2,3-dehydratase family protein [Akkermansiaceae bacterium]
MRPESVSVNTLDALFKWINKENEDVKVELQRSPLSELNSWHYSSENITHESGGFFSVEGLRVTGLINGRQVSWDQPIINQPEHGFLGIIVREFDGVLHFLLQAKIEPGNVNKVQLSPTIQATKSNFSRLHKGRAPEYLDIFQNPNPQNILVDQLQTEQGSRFLRKRNRNVIVYSQSAEVKDEKFKWCTLWQIQQLIRENNIVNMDTRTVLSCMPFELTEAHLPNLAAVEATELQLSNRLFSTYSINSDEFVLNWLTHKKLACDTLVETIPLSKMKKWSSKSDTISHDENKFFKVIGLDVSIENREVKNWAQPMIQPCGRGLIALAYCLVKEVPHFLVRAKSEIGSFDKTEFGPSIQTSFSNLSSDDYWILDQFKKGRRLSSVYQSEEGGRFYHEENLNEIYEIPYFKLDSYTSNFHWMSYRQIHKLMKYSGLVNIELRTILSMVQIGL